MYLLYVFWIGSPILAILTGIGMYAFTRSRFTKLSGESVGFVSILLTAFVIVPAYIFLPFVNPVGEPVAVVTPDNKVIKVVTGRKLLPRWDRSLAGNRVLDLSPISLYNYMELHPISTNPKVRELRYKVTVEATSNPEERVLYELRFGEINTHYTIPTNEPLDSASRAPDYVQYWLYEFNELNSKKLATLYNPKDPNQQKQLTNWLKEFLDPRFKEVGLVFKSSNFTFPNSH